MGNVNHTLYVNNWKLDVHYGVYTSRYIYHAGVVSRSLENPDKIHW